LYTLEIDGYPIRLIEASFIFAVWQNLAFMISDMFDSVSDCCQISEATALHYQQSQ